MDNRNQNPMQPNNLVALNVNMIGSKMSSKREVGAFIYQSHNLTYIDLSVPPNGVQMLPGNI
jgi:hypothetical protein